MNQNSSRILGSIKNPLTLIALFVLLIEAIVALTMTSSVITESQRWWFVGFCTLFPVVVFLVFACIVIWKPTHLYNPKEFKDEKHLFLSHLCSKHEKEIDEAVLLWPEERDELRQLLDERIQQAKQIALEGLSVEKDIKFDRDHKSKCYPFIFDAVGKKKDQVFRVAVKYSPTSMFESRVVDNLDSFFRVSNDGATNIVAIVSDYTLNPGIQEEYKEAINNNRHSAEVVFYSLYKDEEN